MSSLPPNNSPKPSSAPKKSLGMDEWVAIIVALATFGPIFFWIVAKKDSNTGAVASLNEVQPEAIALQEGDRELQQEKLTLQATSGDRSPKVDIEDFESQPKSISNTTTFPLDIEQLIAIPTETLAWMPTREEVTPSEVEAATPVEPMPGHSALMPKNSGATPVEPMPGHSAITSVEPMPVAATQPAPEAVGQAAPVAATQPAPEAVGQAAPVAAIPVEAMPGHSAITPVEAMPVAATQPTPEAVAQAAPVAATPVEPMPGHSAITPVEAMPGHSAITPVEAMPVAATPVEPMPGHSAITPVEAMPGHSAITPVEAMPVAATQPAPEAVAQAAPVAATPVEAMAGHSAITPVEAMPGHSALTPVEAMPVAATQPAPEAVAQVAPEAAIPVEAMPGHSAITPVEAMPVAATQPTPEAVAQAAPVAATPVEPMPGHSAITPVEAMPGHSAITPVEAMPVAATQPAPEAVAQVAPEAATPVEAMAGHSAITPVEAMPGHSALTPVEAMPVAATQPAPEAVAQVAPEAATPVEAMPGHSALTPVEAMPVAATQPAPEAVAQVAPEAMVSQAAPEAATKPTLMKEYQQISPAEVKEDSTKLSPQPIALDSEEGEKLLTGSSSQADYLPLAIQFLSEDNSAYSGVASAVMVLNALEVPAPSAPGFAKQYRFFTQDNVFDNPEARKILSPEAVSAKGMTLKQLTRFLRSYGVPAEAYYGSDIGLDDFREKLVENLEQSDNFVVVNYLRDKIGQEAGGHISPVAAYNKESDRFLILDVSRYKYAPVWVTAEELWMATATFDLASYKSRGFVTVGK